MTYPYLSLRWKVALSFSLLLLAVSAVVALALIRYQWVFLSAEGQKRVESLAGHLANSAREPLLAEDELRLAPIVQSTLSTEDALFAFVVDHRKRVVHHSDSDLIGVSYPDDLPDFSGRSLAAVAPIEVEGVLVGQAVVGLGVDFIRAAMVKTTLGLLLPLLGATVVGVIGIVWLTGVHVERIESLEQTVRAVEAGDMGVRARVEGEDEVGRLASQFNSMMTEINRARGERERNFSETVAALAAALEAKDAYTSAHSQRVGRMSRAIAERVGVPEADLREVELAGILHDVGKIGVDRSILEKTGKLDDAEFIAMKRHPEIGQGILEPLSFLGRVGGYVRHHHEMYDGTGYPDGLAGESIPLASRIIHLVDAYDAMTSTRPYRHALAHDEAFRRIRADSGTHFDPTLVEEFMSFEQEGEIARIRREVESVSRG